MCGIAGFAGDHPPADQLQQVVRHLQHRGPDAQGTRGWSGCVLGHTRLRILDLSPGADQPMSNEDGSVWVVFNGEIYNFVELRRELEAQGHTFTTTTDTEVLVHLYEQHGEDLVHRLRGMFAFALWDDRDKVLVLARDRLGIKPLYYRDGKGGLQFGSEIRALKEPGDTIDPDSLHAFLRLGWVPGPRTILSGISELPPAHVLVWKGSQGRLRRYWSHEAAVEGATPPEPGELGEALGNAARRHLLADVPVGLFLSSGVDSVAVGRLVGQAQPGLQAFTVSFPGMDDEGAPSAILSRRLGLGHTLVPVEGGEVVRSLPRFVSEMDQPTVDGLNSWVISRAVRAEGIVVALSGLGGDELFGGYSTFRHVPRIARGARAVRWLPPSVRCLPASVGGRSRLIAHSRMRRVFGALADGGLGTSYAAVRGLFGADELSALWPPAGRSMSRPLIEGGERRWSGTGVVTRLELTNYLPFQLLRDTDCMSMAHALEVRVPLLDDDVVDLVLRRQASAAPPWTKSDLLDAIDPSFADVAAGPKRTFTLPIDTWLRGPLRETAFVALASLGESDMGFDRWGLTELWHAYGSRRAGWRPVWSLVVLSLWLENHFGYDVRVGPAADGAAPVPADSRFLVG